MLIVLAVIFCIVVATRPTAFAYIRSATIAAPPAVVFAQVNDLHKWQEWSPWAKIDPNAKIIYEGPDAGAGAAYSWAGSAKLGAGRMEITESKPVGLLRFRLDFLKPFKATNAVEFTFKPEGRKTQVTWAMTGRNNFVMKAVGLFIDCEKMCGGQFEQGLAQLASVSEAAARQ